MLAFKLVVVGDYAVGKTTLILNFTEHKFREMYIPTIGVQFSVKDVKLEDEIVKLTVWDIAGQDEFKYVRTEFYKGASAIILVYDITRNETLENLQDWYIDVIQNAGEIPLLILGNKCDLEKKRNVSIEDAKKYVKEKKFKNVIDIVETSAKTSVNVEDAFIKIAEALKN
ncbi:MAG: GTP-binding protein [Candidatus Lokiarchaeota archaeon]|nr:GTP-binding protein [Candidatus Lokiarchaeota archaeon]